ncbi:MAG: hemerythrin domain-containing protein [Burkholderiaceae bacterium]|nr:hemerythrin domain-containing protein [Burkholderiaceae bacterium]
MSTLTWTDDLALGQPRMDATHVEFVDLLASLEAAIATPDAVAPALAALVDHTDAHFAQEDRWMTALGFAPQNCHSFQHQAVLNVMREVQRLHAAEGDVALVQRMAGELAVWFPQHAQMMDAALAETMTLRGYDAETGAMANPPAPEAEAITGCGGSSCS